MAGIQVTSVGTNNATFTITGTAHTNTRYYHFYVTKYGSSTIVVDGGTGSLPASTTGDTVYKSVFNLSEMTTYTAHYDYGTSTAYGYSYTADFTTGQPAPTYYTVTVSAGAGGTASKSPNTSTVESGTFVTFTATPNSGYQFYYWSTTDGTSYNNPLTRSITKNYSAVAYFQSVGPTTYTITYNGNGGTPSRDSDTGNEGDPLTYGLPNATQASDWDTAHLYQIDFNANGGSVSPTYQYTSCSLETYYTFSGWYTQASGGTYVGGYESPYYFTANETLYAHWSTGYRYGDSTLTSLPTPTRTGFTFDGWYTSATGGTQVTTSTVFTSSRTIYAHWIYPADVATINVTNSTATSLTMNVTTTPREYARTVRLYDTSTNYIDLTIEAYSSTSNSGILNNLSRSQLVTISATMYVQGTSTQVGGGSRQAYTALEFSWIYSIATGLPATNLKAERWNTFKNLVGEKASRRHVQYTPLSNVSAGDPITAVRYNSVVNALNLMGFSYSTVTTGSTIYATPFNQMAIDIVEDDN